MDAILDKLPSPVRTWWYNTPPRSRGITLGGAGLVLLLALFFLGRLLLSSPATTTASEIPAAERARMDAERSDRDRLASLDEAALRAELTKRQQAFQSLERSRTPDASALVDAAMAVERAQDALDRKRRGSP
jgi:type II secretory pathway component PulM